MESRISGKGGLVAKGKRILVGKVGKGGYSGKKKDKWEREAGGMGKGG